MIKNVQIIKRSKTIWDEFDMFCDDKPHGIVKHARKVRVCQI
jgi:hypothetical protein